MSTEAIKLKNQLFTSMKNLGLQQQLKKQVRMHLIQKLKAKDMIQKNQSHDTKLFNRILASLISQELNASGCQYSCSVYAAESGYDGKILNRQEMLQVLGIQQGNVTTQDSILSGFVKSKYPFSGCTFKAIGIQTNPQDIGYTLQQRLALIDKDFRKSLMEKDQQNESQFLKAKRKIEETEKQLKRTYSRDIQRFKEFKIHEIKVQIGQEWRKKFEEYSKKVHDDYSRKHEYLRRKTRQLQDELVNKTKLLDQKSINAAKSLKQKTQLLDIRNKNLDEFKKNLQIQKLRNKQETENSNKQLKKKIAEYDNLQLTIKKKIEYQVNVAKLAIQQENQLKQSQFLEKKKYIDQQYGKLMGIKDTTDVIKQENTRLHQENCRLRQNLTELQQQLRVSMSENSSKGDRIQHFRTQMAQLKQQNKQLSQQIQQQNKRRKSNQRSILDLRKQLEQLRTWKQHRQNNLQHSDYIQNKSDSSININKNQTKNKKLGEQQQPKSQLQLKTETLRLQRKKQIQKLRLQI